MLGDFTDPEAVRDALQQAWRRDDLDAVARIREQVDLAWLLADFDQATALLWIHRLVPWDQARVARTSATAPKQDLTSAGDGLSLVELTGGVRRDSEWRLVAPAAWPLEWSVRAAQLWACDCAARAICVAEHTLGLWRVDGGPPVTAIEGARSAILAVRSGDQAAAREAAQRSLAASSECDDLDIFTPIVVYAASSTFYAVATHDRVSTHEASAAALAIEAAGHASGSAATRAAERVWQASRLWDYLCGVTP